MGTLIHLTATEARYVPPGTGSRSGGWELTGTRPDDVEISDSRVLEQIDKGMVPRDWEVHTLPESPFFPGWEERWHEHQSF